MKLSDLQAFYQDHLLNDVVPFWTRHAIDNRYGGIWTGIRDDGSLITQNKYVWSNARAVYTFAALYNRIEQRPEWLAIAENICDFCLAHGRVQTGVWGFLLSREGKMLEGAKAIQVDAFAIMGLTEYARATGDERAMDAAVETFESVRDRLARPGSYGTHPYPIPSGGKAHRDYFQFAFAFHGLGQLLGRKDILHETAEKANEVMDHFRFPEAEVLLEYISADNRRMDTPAGRAMVPGHVIESMWFMLDIHRDAGQTERIGQAVETIRWALEKGWDEEYGGIFLGIDVEGESPVYWRHADKKIWWVFSEALYALLLAYELSGQQWCLDWYWKVHDWTFKHFPDHKHGEWTQKLDRAGRKVDDVVALPVKDPFHLPRALILAIETLGRLSKTAG